MATDNDRPPPDAPEAAEAATGQSASQRLEAPSYSWGPTGSPTRDYIEGRERILGRRPPRGDELVLGREIAGAADVLTDELGPLAARAFVRALLRELEVAL